MSKKILVVTSSIRSTRSSDNILSIINEEIKNFDLDVSYADFKEMPLPFFNSAIIPSGEDFGPTDENVKKWTKMVDTADVVLILSAEYNHSYTAVIKNAIDWIYEEWKDKPVAFIGYGWVGGARAIKHLRDVLVGGIAAKPMEIEANLRFTKEINLDGTPTDTKAAELVKAVLMQI